MRTRALPSALAVLLFAPCVAAAPPHADELRATVTAFLEAKTDPDRVVAQRGLVESKADPMKVAALLAEGRTYRKDVDTGWLRREQKCSDGKERRYLLHVPKDYDPAKRYRFVVDLHGGVSRPALLTFDELEQMKDEWGEAAESKGWILAIPTGERGAEWWTEVGRSNVLGILDATRRTWNVEESRVFATGFSDGGSGSYHLALASPTPFAGFVPLNGHVGVAGAGGLEVHLRNLLNTPMYAVNTDQDSLYPSAALKPIADALKALGAPYVWHEVKGYGHDPSYLPAERPAILAWMEGVTRSPHPARVTWEGAEGDGHEIHWLAFVRVDPAAGGPEVADVNPLLPPDRPRIGVEVDPEHAGAGALVKKVTDGSPAAAMGLLAGDLIVEFDGKEISDLRALRGAIGARKPGDAIRVKVRRGDATLEKQGTLPEAHPEPAFPRGKPWGSIDARRNGNAFDVTCRNVASFHLRLGVGAVDPAQPVVVTVNGREAFRATVAPDLARMLALAGVLDDRTAVYWGEVAIDVPPAAATGR